LPAVDGDLMLPATLSPALQRGLLRRELGFTGAIVSDAFNMAAISQEPGLVVDALAATVAGIDLLLLKHEPAIQQRVYAGLLQAAQRTLLAPAEASASAERCWPSNAGLRACRGRT
jgi:beta-N-acetylhexosaminidase